ncbi:MAG TPA: hypothetical protein VNA13_03145 [Xanthomonadales bacterium]|nr:hypothetical protein [Xanthomonadales bacterium]
MARKTVKAKKKSVKKTVSHSEWDHDFLIIVGGGFILIVIIMMLIAR